MRILSVLGLAILVLIAGPAKAEEVILQLDGLSLIQVSTEGGDVTYRFPEGAHFRLQLGPEQDGFIPVEIPVDGLGLGEARDSGRGRRGLTFSLNNPLTGTLKMKDQNSATLQLSGAVFVSVNGQPESGSHDIQLTTDLAFGYPARPTIEGQSVNITSGDLKIVTGGHLQGDGAKPTEGFHAVLSGQLVPAPESLRDLAEAAD